MHLFIGCEGENTVRSRWVGACIVLEQRTKSTDQRSHVCVRARARACVVNHASYRRVPDSSAL